MFKKKVALILAFSIFFESIMPYQLMALTSGPKQPEFSSFEPVNTTQMVDLFTGDFNYNIPLLNIPGPNGGYPINLFYKSAVNLEEEASMVGFGWNIGIGSISRDVKGIPDDFKNEKIIRRTKIKDEVNVGITGGTDLEIFGAEMKKLGLTLNLSITPLYNNYKGWGLSVGANLFTKELKWNPSIGINLNSFDGVSLSADVTNRIIKGKRTFSRGFGISRNVTDGNTNFNFKNGNQTSGFSNMPDFFPSSELGFTNFSFNVAIKLGVENIGINPNSIISGFVDIRKLKGNNVKQVHNAYGFMYSSEGQSKSNSLLDFNRYKDKAIKKADENLPIPTTNEDIYTITGQGTGGQFKLFRSDIGLYTDKELKSEGGGPSYGFELSGGDVIKVGADLTLGSNTDVNKARGKWAQNYGFSNDTKGSNYQPVYFQKIGETTGEINNNDRLNWPDESDENNERARQIYEDYSYLGNNNLVNFRLTDSEKLFTTPDFGGLLRDTKNNTDLPLKSDKYKRVNRKPKSEIIQGIKGNRYIIENKVAIPYLDIKCKDDIADFIGSPNLETLSNIPSFPKNDQISAFIEHKSNGSRYVYGLPAINFKKKEVTFSVPQMPGCVKNIGSNIGYNSIDQINPKLNKDNENFVDVLETGKYVHTYMLTSVLGDDYIDTDINDGAPNDKDKGYWVKFDYVRTNSESNPFKWRLPFKGAQYHKGQNSLEEDDKASFSYGEKEQYYPYQIETSTHFVKFYYSKRKLEGLGAVDEINNAIISPNVNLNQKSINYQLDKIQLFTKGSVPKLEKEVIFSYGTHGLGSLILNSSGKGKLALKSVTINSFGSKRGNSNPYVFEYFADIDDGNSHHAEYKENAMDRWGVYRSVDPNNECLNFDHPYTNQDENSDDFKLLHLKSIKMPSGSKINLEISRDHYGYVQDRMAGEMFQILGLGNNYNEATNDLINIPMFRDAGKYIYFKLKSNDLPIESYFKDMYQDDKGTQTVVKLRSAMIDLADKTKFEDVIFPVYIDPSKATIESVNGINVGRVEVLSYGFPAKIILKIPGVSTNDIHPFVLLNWQHIKTNLRKLLTPIPTIKEGYDKSTAKNIFETTLNSFQNVLKIFQGFYSRCFSNNYGTKIDSKSSFIRLTSPNNKKLGGDIKVDKITINDIWNSEENQVYGNCYIYGDEDFSSGNYKVSNSYGVATNEPYLGMEENSLYYYKSCVEDIMFGVDEVSFTPYPYNDSYLPGASIGYSKIKVRSLSSQYEFLKNKNATNAANSLYANLPSDVKLSTTGESVNEFYTNKDYPFVFEYSNVNQSSYKPPFFLIPLVGMLRTRAYVGTQGYLVETNDMHGKPKKTANYPQNKNGNIEVSPISYVEYLYHDKNEVYKFGKIEKNRKRLINDVALQLNYDIPFTTKKGELGVNRCLYSDLKFNESISSKLGIDPNLDAFLLGIFPIALPIPWPDIAVERSILKTGVTNKILSRNGIIKKVIAFDGQSKVETDNLVFDPYSGSPTLTSISNEFDNKKFNYTLPAYLGHKRMGSANVNYDVEHQFKRKAENDIIWVYLYGAVPGQGNEGPYLLKTWEINGVNIIPTEGIQFDDSEALKNLMNQLDADANWVKFPTTLTIKGGNPNNTYGVMKIDQIGTTGKAILLPNQDINDIVSFDDCSGLIKLKLNTPNPDKLLIPGDEFVFSKLNCKGGSPASSSDNTIGVFVKESKDCHGLPVYLFDVAKGLSFFNQSQGEVCEYTLLNIRSGNRNLLSVPGQSVSAFDIQPNSNGEVLINQNNVLDAMASEYNDHWHYYENTYACSGGGGGGGGGSTSQRDDGPPPELKNEFSKGSKGIFRNWKNYKFTADRTNNNVQQKGVFASSNGYNLFDWKTIGYGLSTNAAKWLMVAENTKINRISEVVETKNALGIYDAALMVNKANKQNGQQTDVLATIKNSGYYESGVTSFESYELDGNDDGTYNNLDCFLDYNNIANINVVKEHVFPIVQKVSNSSFVIDKKFNAQETYNGYRAEVYYPEQGGIPKTFIANNSSFTLGNVNGLTQVTFDNFESCNNPTNLTPKSIVFYKSVIPNGGTFTYDENAHTGKRSLKMTSGNLQLINKGLLLIPNKKYQFSCWVNDNNFGNLDLKDESVKVNVGGVDMFPVGQKVNGWQQIRGSFVASQLSRDNLSLNFDKGSISSELLIDDVRIHPFEAEMTSYVYDNNTLQLIYTLDDNNYFTKYIYDFNGELIAIQKETERGIKTIKETRTNHIK